MIFEVTAEHIAKLKDDDLRALVGKLCEQELRTQGHSPAAVTWGGGWECWAGPRGPPPLSDAVESVVFSLRRLP